MTIRYAGIGSRTTPANICELMQQLGQKLALKGAELRSGNADGSDKAFERGCRSEYGKGQIFKTNEWLELSENVLVPVTWSYTPKNWAKAEEIASQHHPSWQFLKPYTRKLHTRNSFQILGLKLDKPANFVLCWTPDGARTPAETSQATGGTGQAIRVAGAYGVRVYNLAVKEDLEVAQSWVSA